MKPAILSFASSTFRPNDGNFFFSYTFGFHHRSEKNNFFCKSRKLINFEKDVDESRWDGFSHSSRPSLQGPDDVFYKKSVYTITSRSTHTDELGSILLKISERKNMLLSTDSHGSCIHPTHPKLVEIIYPILLN